MIPGTWEVINNVVATAVPGLPPLGRRNTPCLTCICSLNVHSNSVKGAHCHCQFTNKKGDIQRS
jgi:hypothetical protein